MDEETLKMLNACIRFWESTLLHNQYILEPSTIGLIESTIRFLKQLQLRAPDDETEKKVTGIRSP